VADYNHVVHRICSRLKFCEKEATDADKIEKTLSTMHPSDRVIQQQYRAHGYTVYSKLIHTLSQAKNMMNFL
jgi:endonuclease III